MLSYLLFLLFCLSPIILLPIDWNPTNANSWAFILNVIETYIILNSNTVCLALYRSISVGHFKSFLEHWHPFFTHTMMSVWKTAFTDISHFDDDTIKPSGFLAFYNIAWNFTHSTARVRLFTISYKNASVFHGTKKMKESTQFKGSWTFS